MASPPATQRPAEMIRLLEQAIAERPGDPSLHLKLGLALQAAGTIHAALKSFRRASELDPTNLETWCRLAVTHQQLRQLDDAAAAFSRALSLKPDFAEVACNFGGVLLELGRPLEAIARFQHALAHKSPFPEAQNGLGIAFKKNNQLAEAIAALEKAVALRPSYGEAWFNLGNCYLALERWREAIETYEKALAAGAATSETYNNLGTAQWHARLFASAREAHAKAVALKPDSAEAHNNLGNDLLALGRLEEAAAAFKQAVQLRPNFRDALCNLGNAYTAQNRLDEAILAYRSASATTPFPEAEYNESLARLLQGDFAQGLPKYESRWYSPSSGLKPREYRQPRWRGEELRNRTILLHPEQGLGDTLQFVRYASLLAEKGAKVLLCVQPPLRSLLSSVAGVAQVLTPQETPPPFDYHCPLMSLPLVFETQLDSIPSQVPYVTAPPEKVSLWQQRLSSYEGLKIGLVCSGNPQHRNDHNRSIPLSLLASLGETAGRSFFLLQKELKPSDRDNMASFKNCHDLSSELADFTDTAAIVCNLDLLISVDTSIVHLAGALGRPVWTLLPFSPDWRWLLDRHDSPWYPTMRLFRQPQAGDWSSPLRQIAEALDHFGGFR